MRTLIALLAIFAILTQAHWTQRQEHVMLIQAGPCMSLADAKVDGKYCVYSDVAVEGSLLRQELDVTDRDGKTVSIKDSSMKGMVWNTSATSGFTWRTYALFALWLAIAIWSVIPDLKKLTRGRDEHH